MILQSDDLMLSTVLVSPTSRSAADRVFRPMIKIGGEQTHVLVEQTAAVDATRLGPLVGHATRSELEAITTALRLVLALD